MSCADKAYTPTEMPKLVLQALFVLLLPLSAVAQEATHPAHNPAEQMAVRESISKYYNKNTVKSAPGTELYDVKYWRLDVAVDPADSVISGAVTCHFVPKTNYNTMTMDCQQYLTIDSVKYQGRSCTSNFTGSDILNITLPNAVSVGAMDSLTIWYHGVPRSTGLGSFNRNQHAGQPILWTISTPYGAMDWWPTKQTLEDKADSVEVIVTTPAAYRVASAGKLISETTVSPTHKRYHWKHRFPIVTYLVSLSVTNYTAYSDTLFTPGDTLPILNYVYPESLAAARTGTARVPAMISLFEQLFGGYPFRGEKYGHAQFGWGGGMEHQTMSNVTDFSFELLSHELSHQWFGDKITCGSWRDIWLNEGFATYAAALADLYLNPTNNTWSGWKTSTINAITISTLGSVWVDDTTNANRIFNYRLTYQKGAMLLHMLRWKLGDNDFYQGIRNYMVDPNLAYKYAVTADLQRHLEAVSGQSLTEFFNDWFYGQGHPNYALRWNIQQDGSTILRLSQTPSHNSVSFFEMPVPIRLSSQGGLRDTTVIINHTTNGQTEVFRPSFVVANAQIDFDRWILCRKSVTRDALLSINQVEDAQWFKLFPNPALNLLNIELATDKEAQSIEIINAEGKLAMKSPNLNSSQSASLDVSSLPAGTYYLKITVDGRYQTQPFVKQ